MQIELSHPELSLLRELVNVQRKSLLNEIAHTDDRSYRTELQARYDRLERIEEAIERPTSERTGLHPLP
ncbi:MAG: hypothetical protein F9K40_22460 [Kofleriaceae bacterium]|nr:MAG: hypothetical protein F9K40_22460 [Kofleriaceae bacterium]MBZ0237044.1 hypothetical protein [Kofleriaceae bacterium]